ncbi:TPA: hypothetical protein DCZ81_00200 [Candidatus Collierbacteria bacterium]|nr:hypothetical protein [Candidatus Collierbacteria bacterium]HCX25707.1 hypothetical protein [Candidatus Collierbacteria bacterium]
MAISLHLLLIPIILLAILNFLLVFTPEMGFDALWYHLTLPKLWLLKHQWYFPGGLLYYSVMPRLAETIFIPLIQFTGTIGPKLIQYLAGLGTGMVIWKILSNLKQTKIMKAVGVSLFYCTWLVSWQSGSAYVDLIRTFFEAVALLYLLRGSWKLGGVFLGFAIGTKWLSLGSLAIFSLVFGSSIIFPALLVSLPWFVIAYFYTGNPLYPIFSGVITNSFATLGTALKQVILTPFYLTKPFDDFLSPLVGVMFIFSLLSLRSKEGKLRQIAMVAVLGSLFSLVLDPPSSRFVLPFLPALAIASVMFIGTIEKQWLKTIFIHSVILSGFFILSLRLVAMNKYLPLLTGRMDQKTFLTNYYPRLPGTFLDTDDFVRDLPTGSKILVDKLHNLYYFPRDFDHTSWVNDRSGYDYLVTIGEDPIAFQGELIHTNSLDIQVFKLK